MPVIGLDDDSMPCRPGGRTAHWCHDVGRRHAVRRRAGHRRVRLRPARRRLDGEQLRGRGRRRRHGGAGRHDLDREAQPRRPGRGGQGQHRRAVRRRQHPPSPRPHVRQRVPARGDAGHRPRQVPRDGGGGRARGDQGHHRAGLRRPRAAAAGDHLLGPDDPAPAGPGRRAAPCRRPGAHDERRPRVAARAQGAVQRRPRLQRRPAVRVGGLRRRLPPRDRPDAGARARGAGTRATARCAAATTSQTLLSGHGRLPRLRRAGGRRVARRRADSARGRAEAPRQPVLHLGRDRALRRQPHPRLRGDRRPGHLDPAHRAQRVWPDMVAFHGGPIACHA